ncbi:MAG: lipid-binding protein [Bacteroides sp.]|uniref:lipid-binding protein n=1 Tax=Bacteroides sp. TaxID=29523 RepID=UPI002FC581FA
MKQITYICLFLLATLSLVSCNSEDRDYDIEYTAIHPLGGQYVVSIMKNGVKLIDSYCTLSNTTNNDADKCWIRIGSYTTAAAYAINGKIACDVPNLMFRATDIENLAGNVVTSTHKFTITNAKVELKGIKAPSGTIADKISFTYTTTKDPGVVYTVEGWRYTGWPEDDY